MDQSTTIPQSAPLTAPFTQGGLVLGITGPTGSGKTTLLRLIQEHGGVILDCDAIYHELLRTDKKLLAAIETRFPGTVEDGQLNRKKLGATVFSDEAALLDLNAITHTAVKQEVLRQLTKKPALAAIDAIGLFEGGLAELCDTTVAVTAPREVRIARIMTRDNIPEDYAAKRVDAQHPNEWFAARCDCTLENSSSEEAFQAECIAFFARLGIMKA